MVDVVAALIVREGRFLICRRPASKARGLLWEFVGGKVEPGESREEALARECMEELDVKVKVGDLYAELIHSYPDISIRLLLYRASIEKGRPKLIEHCDMRWISPGEIDLFDFCPADADILKKIRSEGI